MNKEKIKKLILSNLWRIILLAALIIILWAYKFVRANSYLCEFLFARKIGRGYYSAISKVTNLIPFSVTEWAYVIAIIAIITIITTIIVYLCKKKFCKSFKILYNVTCFVLALLVLTNAIYTASYSRYPVSDYLNLSDAELSLKNCSDASLYYSDVCNELADNFEFDENGDVISPYTFSELNDLINEEYHRFEGEYLSTFYVRAKPVLMSKVMSYSGITGQFVSFFAESNVSTDIPPYQLPETIAHEIAHAKGVSREDEANYIAYYLLITSDNDYLRYCGCMYASVKMLSESYDKNDTSYYQTAYSAFTQKTLTQYSNSDAHWASYDTFWDDWMDELNDRYLKSSGQTEGVKSYSQTGLFLLRLFNTVAG